MSAIAVTQSGLRDTPVVIVIACSMTLLFFKPVPAVPKQT
jgi:hypothetical protein